MTNINPFSSDILKTYKIINKTMSNFGFSTQNDNIVLFTELINTLEKLIDNDNIVIGIKPKKLKLLIPKKYKGIIKGLHPDKEKLENIVHEKDNDEKYNFIDNGGYSSIKKSKNITTKEIYFTNVKLKNIINDSNFASLYFNMISRLDDIYLNDIKLNREELMEFYLVIHTVQDITLNIKNSEMINVFPELYAKPSFKNDKFKNYEIKLYEKNDYFTVTDRLSSIEIDNYIPYTVEHHNNHSGTLYTNIYALGFGNNSINMDNLKEFQNQEIIRCIIQDYHLIFVQPPPPPLIHLPTPSPSPPHLPSPTETSLRKNILNNVCFCIK